MRASAATFSLLGLAAVTTGFQFAGAPRGAAAPARAAIDMQDAQEDSLWASLTELASVSKQAAFKKVPALKELAEKAAPKLAEVAEKASPVLDEATKKAKLYTVMAKLALQDVEVEKQALSDGRTTPAPQLIKKAAELKLAVESGTILELLKKRECFGVGCDWSRVRPMVVDEG